MAGNRSPQKTWPCPPSRLPSADALAALGVVLCLYRSRYGGELGGWEQAASVEVHSGIDSDGWHECLQFRDRDGVCCWRLYLLPESDFLAWDRLQAPFPAVEFTPIAGQVPAGEGIAGEGVAGRLWRRLSACIDSDRWQYSVVRLHAVGAPRPSLAASLAPVSRLGAEMVRRVARLEGLEASHAIGGDGGRPCSEAHTRVRPEILFTRRTYP